MSCHFRDHANPRTLRSFRHGPNSVCGSEDRPTNIRNRTSQTMDGFRRQDLSDATYHGNTSTRVRAAEHAEAGQCDIIVVTAGAAQKKGE